MTLTVALVLFLPNWFSRYLKYVMLLWPYLMYNNDYVLHVRQDVRSGGNSTDLSGCGCSWWTADWTYGVTLPWSWCHNSTTQRWNQSRQIRKKCIIPWLHISIYCWFNFYILVIFKGTLDVIYLVTDKPVLDVLNVCVSGGLICTLHMISAQILNLISQICTHF